jgi:hypothetical protein
MRHATGYEFIRVGLKTPQLDAWSSVHVVLAQCACCTYTCVVRCPDLSCRYAAVMQWLQQNLKVTVAEWQPQQQEAPAAAR